MSIFGRNAVGDVALIHHALVVFTTFFAAETQSHQELITTLPEPPGVEERICEGVQDTQHAGQTKPAPQREGELLVGREADHEADDDDWGVQEQKSTGYNQNSSKDLDVIHGLANVLIQRVDPGCSSDLDDPSKHDYVQKYIEKDAHCKNGHVDFARVFPLMVQGRNTDGVDLKFVSVPTKMENEPQYPCTSHNDFDSSLVHEDMVSKWERYGDVTVDG